MNGQIYTIYVLLARALVRIFDYLKILIFQIFILIERNIALKDDA